MFLIDELFNLKFLWIRICIYKVRPIRIFFQSEKRVIICFFDYFNACYFLSPVCFIRQLVYFILYFQKIIFLFFSLYLPFLFNPLDVLQIDYYLLFKWGPYLLLFRALFCFLRFWSFGILCFCSYHDGWYVLICLWISGNISWLGLLQYHWDLSVSLLIIIVNKMMRLINMILINILIIFIMLA